MTDPWSEVAETWAQLWGGFAGPAQREIAEVTGIGPGVRVLDIGCGSGEFLAYVHELCGEAVGIDSSPGMVALAKQRAPHAEVRLGDLDRPLPWPDDDFDVVTAFNVLEFAADPVKSVDEFAFMGTQVALVGWAERARNDFNAIDEVLADEPSADGEFRKPGGFEAVLREVNLKVSTSGLVEVVWEVPDEETLLRGILLGENPQDAPTVVQAAKPFKTADGGYRLVNHFRYAIGTRP
ncbi:methyltransferase domain-containing protein [Kibdelosporangium philippinense]|uniref:Methyltransferase domain-containing protein n=1 Tax=Kibdelosporangium philippinense TaxID=211113 RepID=A0ABS8Z8K3_9PSEU|nr:methyltransferase domain-containing protein [Kibdelosporangium philippinense]MCE7004145.1 methyltransferase domain-containing protein [Kibdelosporangium philippinense]